MKTRSGFVSNSSSSSFICVIAKEDHEKILSQLDGIPQLNFKIGMVDGKEVMVCSDQVDREMAQNIKDCLYSNNHIEQYVKNIYDLNINCYLEMEEW